jgi:hypothetical protein
MPSQELMGRVAELRRDGRTPKEIARALGLKPAEVAPLIRAVGAAAQGSSVSACGYLVDVWCLGVKNCTGPKTMDRRKLPDFVSVFFRTFSRPPVSAPLELAQNVVFGAVEYARGLGFEPHPDFAKCARQLGDWGGSSDITFGRDGMPMYMQGPYDDTYTVMSILRKTVGDGNFHYLGRIS